MKIMFIDESKKQEGKSNKYFFILTGLLIDEEKLFDLEQELRTLKENYSLLNLKELRGNKLKINKIKCSEEISKILQDYNVQIISIILGRITLKKTTKIEDNYFNAITFLIERFFLHLKKENKLGFIIHDSVPRDVEKNLRCNIYSYILKEEIIMYKSNRHLGLFKKRIYPSILFSNDEHSEILQTSDLISASLNSAVFKTLNSSNRLEINNLNKHNSFLNIYWPLFVRDGKGDVSGWGIKSWW